MRATLELNGLKSDGKKPQIKPSQFMLGIVLSSKGSITYFEALLLDEI